MLDSPRKIRHSQRWLGNAKGQHFCRDIRAICFACGSAAGGGQKCVCRVAFTWTNTILASTDRRAHVTDLQLFGARRYEGTVRRDAYF